MSKLSDILDSKPGSMTKASMNYILGALVAINVLVTVWHGLSSFRRGDSGAAKIDYTYNGNSIPLMHPVQFQLNPVALTLQESTRYAWNDPSNVTREEYNSLFKYPALSFLGPNYRQTITLWYHNFHCIAQIRTALQNHSDVVANTHHFQHCLQYLRQFLLCGATDMLEDGDFMKRDFTVDRVGSQLVCQDWNQAFDALRHEQDGFMDWYRGGQVPR